MISAPTYWTILERDGGVACGQFDLTVDTSQTEFISISTVTENFFLRCTTTLGSPFLLVWMRIYFQTPFFLHTFFWHSTQFVHCTITIFLAQHLLDQEGALIRSVKGGKILFSFITNTCLTRRILRLSCVCVCPPCQRFLLSPWHDL